MREITSSRRKSAREMTKIWVGETIVRNFSQGESLIIVKFLGAFEEN